jgi:hypothetical protein
MRYSDYEDSPRQQRRVAQTKPRRYQSARAVITGVPKNECSVFHNHVVRHEVAVSASLELGGKWFPYILRFVHPRNLASAQKLHQGLRIEITRGYFRSRKGRENLEFYVNDFELVSDTKAHPQSSIAF